MGTHFKAFLMGGLHPSSGPQNTLWWAENMARKNESEKLLILFPVIILIEFISSGKNGILEVYFFNVETCLLFSS